MMKEDLAKEICIFYDVCLSKKYQGCRDCQVLSLLGIRLLNVSQEKKQPDPMGSNQAKP